MAVTGLTRVVSDRRFEDYRSMKQHFKHRHVKEFIINGTDLSAGAAAEVNFSDDIAIHYIAANGQVYIRCEADDANQHSKYVYIEYINSSGTIGTIRTADLHATDSTTEVIVTGASDFYRLRQMYSEVESASGGGKAIMLTDANMGGADDHYACICDGKSHAQINRYFAPIATTCTSYLGKVDAKCVNIAEAAAGYFVEVILTPKVVNLGEAQVAADVTFHLEFTEFLNWEPCIELQPATDVIIKIGDNATAGIIHLDISFLEVYARV